MSFTMKNGTACSTLLLVAAGCIRVPGATAGRSLLVHERQREPIVTFAANGLNGRGADALLASEHGIQATNTAHARILARIIDDFAIADDVVYNDESAWCGHLERAFEVAW